MSTNGIANGGTIQYWKPYSDDDNFKLNQFYIPENNQKNAELSLIEFVKKKHNLQFDDYESWYRWTCDYPELFWEDLLIFSGIKLSSGYTQVLEKNVAMKNIPKWFVGAKLNYAENCLLNGKDGHPAFIQASDSSTFKYYDYSTLKKDVASVSSSLRQLNIKPGDRICGYLPNIYETSVAMLATATIGAVWSSASCDFGPTGVLDRFGQIDPKILFVTNITSYKRKQHSLINKVNEIVNGLPTLEKVVVIPFDGHDSEISKFENKSKIISYDDLKKLSSNNTVLKFEQVPFNHPLFIMFSSGTTGIPKGMIHTVGGTLLKHVEEHVIQTDMKSSDRIMFYTTIGWMMWNFCQTILFTGGTIILYDESPLEPDPYVLLKICQNTKATILGMGAKIWDEYAKMDMDFKRIFDLSSLRLALSTGSPLKASTFSFINNYMRPKIVIGSISGGTDIVGCFVGACLNRPVIPGECQHFYLGMNMHAYNSEGKSVYDEQGELVCITPFPSMPSMFINDKTGERYFNAYFNGYEGIWTHGDYSSISSKTKGVVIFGRSDATLNRGGVRIGTAEIYNVVERINIIEDAVVVGKTDPDDENNELVLLFVKMKNNVDLTPEIEKQIKTELRNQMSPRHVPNHIYKIEDIPYTNSGKKVELAVKEVLKNKPVKNINSIRNPEALQYFAKYAS